MKRLFSGKLFLEGMRRLLLPGTIGIAVMAALQMLAELILNTSPRSMFYSLQTDLLGLVTAVLPGAVLPFLFVSTVFGFLHRREGSDFYHALSVPRSSQAVSLWLAAMVWVVIAAIAAIVMLPLIVVFSGRTVIKEQELLLGWGTLCVVALLSAGASLLATCLTGTRFTAAGVTAIILLLPRLWVGSFVYLLYAQLPLVSEASLPLFRLNLLADTLTGSMLHNTVGVNRYIIEILPACIYTGVLGLLYAGLGVWAYCRRKSEAAGRAVPNRFLQAVYRISLALLFCAPACEILLAGWSSRYPWVIFFFLLALIAYLLFELFTTRRWSSLLRALPGLLAVAAINLLFIGGYRLVRDRILMVTPEPEEITSVRFLNEKEWFNVGARRNDWLVHRLCRESFEDLTVREMVAKNLKGAVTQVITGADLGYSSNPITVEILCGDKTYLRRLPIHWWVDTLFSDGVLTGEKGRQIASDLPAVSADVTLDSFGELKGEAALQAYDILRQEFRQADTTALARYLQGVYKYDSQMRPTYPYQSEYGNIWVDLTVREEENTYTLSLPVPSFCPRTLTAYYQAMKQGKSVLAELMEEDDLQRIDYTIHHSPDRSGTLGGTLLLDAEYIGYDIYWDVARDLWDRLEDDLDLAGMTVELRMELKEGADYSELFALREIPESLRQLHQWQF